jgi:hypothetical protein
VLLILYATGCFKCKKRDSTTPEIPQEATNAAEVLIRQATEKLLSDAIKSKNEKQALHDKQDNPKSVKLPFVCKIWDRWQHLNHPLHIQDVSKVNLLGDGWNNGVCPAIHLYQQLNQKDHWCVKPQTRGDETAKICAQYISNDSLASPIEPTCSDDSNLAPFDRWVQLKEPLGIAHGTYQGSAWQQTVCPAGSAFQLLADRENWCVPIENISQATQAAAE